MVSKLSHKRIAQSAGAIAGLASALSVVAGMLATRAAPKGWSRVAVALHLSKAPLIERLAPIIAGLSLIIATAAGILTFYSWCKGEEESRDPQKPSHELTRGDR